MEPSSSPASRLTISACRAEDLARQTAQGRSGPPRHLVINKPFMLSLKFERSPWIRSRAASVVAEEAEEPMLEKDAMKRLGCRLGAVLPVEMAAPLPPELARLVQALREAESRDRRPSPPPREAA